MTRRAAFGFLFLVLTCCVARPALAQSAPVASDVNRRPHRVSAELGAFEVAQDGFVGAGFGLGYGFRPINGLELGAGVRYFVRPSRTEWIAPAAPLPGEPAPPAERNVDEGFHFWLLAASVRGFLEFGPERRFEVGLSARGGLVNLGERRGFCCVESALAPDLRVRVLPRAALALAPEVAISTTGVDRGEEHGDEIFGYAAVWLSAIQSW
jgi:hypothetical protein